MDVGREFSSWETFQRALDQYSQENKVVYIVGTCKPVETVNKNELLLHKFPEKFKYCFARMVCKHYGSYSSKSLGQRPNQRTCKTGCTSSIMVSVNKKRTCLVIKDANLQHSHTVSASIFSSYSQTRRLQGDERRMASILLRAGVPLLRVQEFISHACHKDPTIKDLQNLRSSTSQAQDDSDKVAVEEFAFLNDVDKLMAEDSEAIVEIINFDLTPGAIYIQTSSMMTSLKAVCCEMIQVVTHLINNGKVSVISIVGLDTKKEPQVIALCIILVVSDTALRCFFEAFVRNNSDFCDHVNSIILDCTKENIDFFQQLIPQAHMAWSRSYVSDAFARLAKSDMKDVIESLLNGETEAEYEQNLKRLMNAMNVSDYKEFLNTWDASKDLWALHEMSSFPHIRLQKASLETHYLKNLKLYLRPQMTTSKLVKALLSFVRNEEPAVVEESKPTILQVDPSCKFYQELCFRDAYSATQCQIAMALGSTYEINQQTDVIFIKRNDSDEEYVLNISGTSCTCPYFLKEELPCQHIFAWLKSSGKPLYDESLIPLKWQVFGTAVTLDAIAESLSQGHVPSSLAHDDRIKELQSILKELLATTCAHSFEQMGKDMALLRQVLVLMKNHSTYNAKVVIESDSLTPNASSRIAKDANTILTSPPKKPGRPKGKRGRGRPSNKEKLLRMMEETNEGTQNLSSDYLNSNPTAKKPRLEDLSPPGITAPCHNLRKNIKHKFVSSEASSRIAPPTTGDFGMYSENEDTLQGNIVSIMQVEEDENKVVTSVLNSDRTEMHRSVLPKTLLMAENTLVPSNDADSNQSMHVFQNQSLNGKQDDAQRNGKEDNNDEEDEDSLSDPEEDSDEDSGCQESAEEKRERRKQELAVFMNEFSLDFLNEVLQTVVLLDYSEEREDKELSSSDLASQRPTEVLINSSVDTEEVNFVASYILSLCPHQDQHTYQVAAYLLCKANLFGVPILSLLQSVNPWPSHLPDFPSSRPFEGEVTLNPGQTLTLCGHKLDQEDMDSLRVGKEITSETVHAYLEILAQKHSGKMFVLPFSVVHVWRNGSYTDMLFKKVHFKTFEYLVLPIHCGGEFSQYERESINMQQPCWMALVADVKAKTVSVLNPRTEDCFAVAANGYMLQWRRYMQIRSVHTREMLSAWSSKPIHCSKTDKEGFSAIMLLMNIEALICGAPPVIMHPAIHASRYRHHVAACLRDTDWQTTVLCVGGPECQRMAARDADWVQCENCRAWWHRACASTGTVGQGDREPTGKAGIFYCTSCRQRIQALGNVNRGGCQLGHREEDQEEDLQEEDNQEEDEGEEEFDEGEGEGEEEMEDGEETMKINEISEEDRDGEVNLLLGSVAEMQPEEN